MKIKGNCATYLQGIRGFEEYNNQLTPEQNPNLVTMKYGMGSQFVFRKEDAYDLILAIYGKEHLVDTLNITREKFDQFVEKHGLINTLNSNLTGHGVVFVTNFKNYLDYSNAGHSALIGITGMDLDGEFLAQDTSELFADKVTYEEMYEYGSKTNKDTGKEL